jgi:hypothetical protein
LEGPNWYKTSSCSHLRLVLHRHVFLVPLTYIDIQREVPYMWVHNSLDIQREVPYDTQFLFGSLMFTIGEDGKLDLLTWGPAPSRLAPVYRKASYFLTDSSTSLTSGGVYSGLNPHAWLYYLSAMMAQGHLIEPLIFQPRLEHRAPHLQE